MKKTLAQIINPVLPDEIGRGGTEQGPVALGTLLGNTIGGIVIIAFLVAMMYLMTGAFHWITSGGDKANLESARGKIIHSIVGLIIISAVWATMTIVGQFLGISFPDLPIPSIPKN